MIYSVRCDKPSFRTVGFEPGMNVILADRTKESTKKGSRNGLGKSTLIEIMHFCLGGTPSPERLGSERLLGWTFTLDIALAGRKVSVSRNTEAKGKVAIEGDTTNWPLQPARNRKTGQDELSDDDWKHVLGHLAFGLDVPGEPGPYQPRFRSLIPYFMRLGRDAYTSPFRQFRQQSVVDVQLFNAFLLGLEWRYARQPRGLGSDAGSVGTGTGSPGRGVE